MNGVTYECEGAKQRIEETALSLSGLSSPPENQEALYQAAVNGALSICGRKDVPEAMESALAVILSEMYQQGLNRPVSTVKRGDTSITYTSGELSDTKNILAPFIRLRTV